MAKKSTDKAPDFEGMDLLMLRYNRGTQDMDTRRTRRNGWNDIISSYMGKLPANWPYMSMVTDPRIRTAILEKTARLLNSKLQGRVVPREGGDIIKAKIQNALLDFQWDFATEGGAMIEKVAQADQLSRIFGASFAQVYWDTEKESNEIKIIDPRDIFFDPSATHVRNAKYVMIREFTTVDQLEDKGYDVTEFKRLVKAGMLTSELKNTSYESIVKANKGLQDRVGEIDDPKNPTVEVVTQYTEDETTVFLPRNSIILEQDKNKYKHGYIPVAQLRYYPLGDDIIGESEVECVMPLQKAINAILCGFLDEVNIRMRPPLKISSSGVRIDTIQYGPGAQWIMQNPNLVQQMEFSQSALSSFNTTYPALVGAFNTAMGDSSLGVSAVKGSFSDKTATEVKQLTQQQNSRDNYNQLYLTEFLKDIVMMWMSNNKQFLFDDPKKSHQILKIVGKSAIDELMALGLGGKDIPSHVMNAVSETVASNPGLVAPDQINQIGQDTTVPTNPVITNPEEINPENYDIKSKLDVTTPGQEAQLYMTKDDFEGVYDYIPDVKSMALGAGEMMKEGRTKVLEMALNPQTNQMMAQQGDSLKIKDVLIGAFEDAGYKDAESLFDKSNPAGVGLSNGQPQLPGSVPPQAGAVPPGIGGVGGVPPVSAPVPNGSFSGGLSQPQGLQG